MERDYQKWHVLKSEIDCKNQSPLFRDQEIWWCSLGANVGVEEDGKNELFERPILILRKFNREMFWALPMTSRKKEGKFYCSFAFHNTERTAILSQLRTLSSKRLIRRVGKISDKQFDALRETITTLLTKRNGPLAGSSSA
ncbi:MAG: type II toxin-antitoxin system PemK/MazF family toxin [Patescibacteria group bacterium]